MSPAHFKNLYFQVLKRVVETSKANGAYFIKHCDGNVWPLLDMIIDTGIDAFHPFQPDVMDINEAKRKYKNKITLVGNIDCGDLLCNGIPGEVENAVKKTIRNVGKDGGFILASSNCISAGVKAENYLTMLEAVEKWGYYPLADK